MSRSTWTIAFILCLATPGRPWFAPPVRVSAGEPQILKGIVPGAEGGGRPEGFTPFGDPLFFSAQDPAHGDELWVSDGTPQGTRLFQDIVPGARGSDPGATTALSSHPAATRTAALGDRLFFQAWDPTHGRELWISDGTLAGTVLVKDTPGQTAYRWLTSWGDQVFFTAQDPEHGRELWVSDGTPDGTMLFKDINPGIEGSDPRWLTVWCDRLFFSAWDPEHGEELWVLPLDEAPPPPPTRFRRGDASADGKVEINDAILVLTHLFLAGPAPSCADAADANDDGAVDLSDPVAVLTRLFLGGGPLPAPEGCGEDPTADALACAPGC